MSGQPSPYSDPPPCAASPDLAAEVGRLRAIVADLAARDPIAWGRDAGACALCGGVATVDDDDPSEWACDHDDDCPWVLAAACVAEDGGSEG